MQTDDVNYIWLKVVFACIQALHKMTLERDQLKLELERRREEQAQAQELLHVVREERNEARLGEARLREERDKVREESMKAKEDKERLESKVALLEERCNRLSRRVRYDMFTDVVMILNMKLLSHCKLDFKNIINFL